MPGTLLSLSHILTNLILTNLYGMGDIAILIEQKRNESLRCDFDSGWFSRFVTRDTPLSATYILMYKMGQN